MLCSRVLCHHVLLSKDPPTATPCWGAVQITNSTLMDRCILSGGSISHQWEINSCFYCAPMFNSLLCSPDALRVRPVTASVQVLLIRYTQQSLYA